MTDFYTEHALFDIELERKRQTKKHGAQWHVPDGTGPEGYILAGLGASATYPDGDLETLTNAGLAAAAKRRCQEASQNEGGDGTITFEQILTEEWAEAMAETDPLALRNELVQVAAVAVQWIEKLDRARAGI